MTKKVTYNLNFLAKSVFELDKEDQKILRILADQKDHKKGINQTQITKYFSSLDSIYTRKSVRKKLFGTKRKDGLISNGYVVPKKENKKRYGKDEISFHLTFKGLFGALASGVTLKKIYNYKIFLKAIDHYIADKKIREIIKQHNEFQMQSFLLWHYIYGIQLKNITMFQNYYTELNEREFHHADFFGITIDPNAIEEYHNVKKINYTVNLRNPTQRRGKGKKFVTEIINIFSLYFTYKGIINVLRINGIIPTAMELLKQDMNSPDSDEALDCDKLIDYWSNYIGGVHLAEKPSDMLYGDTFVLPRQSNITFLPQAYRREEMKKAKKDEVKNRRTYISNVDEKILHILKKNKFKVEIPDDLNRPIGKYSF